jgi:hypothetical protein
MAREPGQGARRGTRRAALAVGGLGLVGAALNAGATATEAWAESSAGIEGAWLIRWGGLTRQHVRASAFLPGGVVIIVDSPIDTTTSLDDAEDEIEYHGPAIGQWLRTGFDEYAYTAVEVEYDHVATVRQLATYRGTIHHDLVGDGLTGSFRLTETTLDGRTVATRESAFAGTRIKVEA